METRIHPPQNVVKLKKRKQMQGLTWIRGFHENVEPFFSGLGGGVRKADIEGGQGLLGWPWEKHGRKLLGLGKKLNRRKEVVLLTPTSRTEVPSCGEIMSLHPHGPFSKPMLTQPGEAQTASFSARPGSHQRSQPPVSHPTHHQSQLAVSPSEMIPGTVTRMIHDCSDLPPLCPGKALDEPGTHSCR